MFTVRRSIELDAGHRVPYHGSHCRFLHGHRYKVTAVVAAADTVPAATRRSDAGMVLDFGVIKQVLLKEVHEPHDHRLLLWTEDVLLQDLLLGLPPEIAEGIVCLPCVPTAEELARYWGSRVVEALRAFQLLDAGPPALCLQALEVWETPTSMAVWTPEDPSVIAWQGTAFRGVAT